MEINLLKLQLEQSLTARTSSSITTPKLPHCLQDNFPEEIEDVLQIALQALVGQRGVTYEDITAKEMEEKVKGAVKWLTGPRYRSCLLLQGTKGNGKTTLLMAIYMLLRSVNASIMQIGSVKLFEYYIQSLNGQSSAYFEYKTSKRLCIDELGTEPARCQIYGVDYTPIQDILTYRYERQLPTIISTNLSDAMIQERYGERIADRFAEMCTILRFTAPSYRK